MNLTEHIDFLISEAEDTYVPPADVASEARRALAWKEKYGEEVKGGTQVGWIRANQLSNRENLSYDTVKRMYNFFNRHQKNKEISPKNKNEPWKDNGHVAWLIWGGDAGRSWASEIVNSKGPVAESRSNNGSLHYDPMAIDDNIYPCLPTLSEVKNPYGKVSRGNDTRWLKGSKWAQERLAALSDAPDFKSSVVKDQIEQAKKALVRRLTLDIRQSSTGNVSPDAAVESGLASIAYEKIFETAPAFKQAVEFDRIAWSKSSKSTGLKYTRRPSASLKEWDPFWRGVYDVAVDYRRQYHLAIWPKYQGDLEAMFMDRVRPFLEDD